MNLPVTGGDTLLYGFVRDFIYSLRQITPLPFPQFSFRCVGKRRPHRIENPACRLNPAFSFQNRQTAALRNRFTGQGKNRAGLFRICFRHTTRAGIFFSASDTKKARRSAVKKSRIVRISSLLVESVAGNHFQLRFQLVHFRFRRIDFLLVFTHEALRAFGFGEETDVIFQCIDLGL